MFAQRPSDWRIIGQAGLRMVALDDARPLTSQVKVGVNAINKKGAVLILDSPFIDGSHVLMDVHNIIPKLAQVAPWGQDQESGPALSGEVVRFDRLELPDGVRFLVELLWTGGSNEQRQQALKRLQQAEGLR
ncbi:MAG: hypothetical protein HY794_15210 [Desulfarculus sp.]|nr:hypothetical protein [Desulfarculus sp.]